MKTELTFEEMMNYHPLVEIDKINAKDLKPGTLIGFKSYGDKISAAYPLCYILGERIEFYLINEPGKLIRDATRMGGCFVNDPAQIVEVHKGGSSPFGAEIAKLFNGKTK